MFLLEPQFLDIFGFLGFVYIVALSLAALFYRPIPKWAYVVLFLIGLVGLIVDWSVVYLYFLK